jgi:hypothetical protein
MIDKTAHSETTVATGKASPFFSCKRPVTLALQKSFCIPCAVENNEFKERAPASFQTPLDAGDGHRAWIGGRSYVILHHPAAKVVCAHCGKEVHVAYVPEEERLA